jgi:hypothetical protein
LFLILLHPRDIEATTTNLEGEKEPQERQHADDEVEGEGGEATEHGRRRLARHAAGGAPQHDWRAARHAGFSRDGGRSMQCVLI